jgi:glutamine synthetase
VDILKQVADANVKFIELQFTDILGFCKSVSVPVSQIEKVLDGKCMFDGSSVEGFVRIQESDMRLVPDINTFLILPYMDERYKTARIICDVYTTENKPFEGDPRWVLKKVLRRASDMGYAVNIGPECEFFLFGMAQGKPTLQDTDSCGYFDLAPMDLGDTCRKAICVALEQMGFVIETSHHECAPGQHEIDFKYGDALKMADDIVTFKTTVKAVAMQHGLHATFMPKPKQGIAGSGMHVNISLDCIKTGVNLFCDDTTGGLSRVAMSFIAGLMEHVPSFTVITNPLVNSYKRLVSGHEAPVYIAYSFKNRSPLIRIPSASGKSTRIELRSPDPSCNPYLALATVIASGLDGIKNDLTPPASVDENIYELPEQKRKDLGIENLPNSLYTALGLFEKSKFMRDTLGDHITGKYIEAKYKEWQEYKTQISDWEIETYLTKY